MENTQSAKEHFGLCQTFNKQNKMIDFKNWCFQLKEKSCIQGSTYSVILLYKRQVEGKLIGSGKNHTKGCLL